MHGVNCRRKRNSVGNAAPAEAAPAGATTAQEEQHDQHTPHLSMAMLLCTFLRIKLSSEPGPSAQMPASPSNSHPAQPGALEPAANGVHEAGEERQLMPLVQRHSSLADMRLPCSQLSCPGALPCEPGAWGSHLVQASASVLLFVVLTGTGLPKQAETAVHALATPQAGAPQAAPLGSTPPPRWPRHSKQTANVTLLHGGGKKSGLKQTPQPAPPAGFAVKSSPTAPASGMVASAAGPSSMQGGLTPHPTQVRQSDDDLAQRPSDFPRVGQPPMAASREPAAASSSMATARRSHSSSKPELPVHKANPVHSVNAAPLHLPPPNTLHPCSAQALPQVSHGADAMQQRRLSCLDHAEVSQRDPLGATHLGCLQKGEPPSAAAAAATHPGTASQPATAWHHRQTASAAGPWGGTDDELQMSCMQGFIERSESKPFSWGLRKPRTRYQGSRLSGGSMTDLAVVAAAATAEAEQAAASAMARVHADYDESASQSDAQQRHHQPCHPQTDARQTRRSLRSHSLPPRGGPAPQQPCSSVSRGYLGPDSEAPMPAPRRGAGRKGNGPRTGRNHHRAGASPSNLHKDLGYIGSNFLGVNGVRHGMDFPLRWKAGTWDPVVKKTVYIGSFDSEVDAAKAVDAWHVSCGRPPVNFVEPEPQPSSHKQQRQAKALVHNGLEVKEECLAWPPANESSSDEDPYYVELKASDGYCMPKLKRSASVSAQQAAPHEAAQRDAAEWLPTASPSANRVGGNSNGTELAPAVAPSSFLREATEVHGIDHTRQSVFSVDMPERASTADGFYITTQECSPEPAVPVQTREGVQAASMVEPHAARNCRGILSDDGKWRAQIKVQGDMQLLGCFDNKKDAAQAYAFARRQKLLMHVS
ncbi:hypothetical protein ABBQ32_012845 [Trebouxia sp. C0010 RCD-2024]